jgi:hypothetical protein
MNNKDIFLKTSLKLLDKLKVNHWIINGTLLGIVRDNEQIQWDNEIDVGVLNSDLMRDDIISLFSRNGYLLTENNLKSDNITFKKNDFILDINIFRLEGDLYKTIWEIDDFSILERIINRFIKFSNFMFFQNFLLIKSKQKKYLGYSIPKDCLFPLFDMKYKDFIVVTPLDSNKTLRHIYGKDWKIPNKKYNWIRDGNNNAG